MAADEARVAVPATLNVGALDLLRPENVRLPPARAAMAKRLMDAYLALGCSPTWTCAPYQAAHRPSAGHDVARGERTAGVFASSLLFARPHPTRERLDR